MNIFLIADEGSVACLVLGTESSSGENQEDDALVIKVVVQSSPVAEAKEVSPEDVV